MVRPGGTISDFKMEELRVRVFIYEFICGGGLAGRPLPESLAREGWAMLASVAEDFSRIAGCHVLLTLDDRFADRPLPAEIEVVRMHGADSHRPNGTNDRDIIERLARSSDWTLVIAPEHDGILFNRVQWVEQVGGRLLGPSSAAIGQTSDKWLCGQRLRGAGVPAVVGKIIGRDDVDLSSIAFPAVLKPRDGAGSQSTYYVADRASLAGIWREAATSELPATLIEPFMPGIAASVSFLIGPASTTPLLAGEQRLSRDGRFRYLGGRMPLDPKLTSRAVALGRRAVAATPGLAGYVGVDLVLNDSTGDPAGETNQQAHTDMVIEINPRLTTSYVGLRALCHDNLAALMIDAASGRSPSPRWKSGAVTFLPDGQIAAVTDTE